MSARDRIWRPGSDSVNGVYNRLVPVTPQRRFKQIAARLEKLDGERAKLASERDNAMLELIAAGHTQTEVAGMAGISKMRVSVIANKATAKPTRSPGGSAKPRGTTHRRYPDERNQV